MNVRLLRKIQKHILAEPRRLMMGDWGEIVSSEAVKYDPKLPPCGTTACIAGWAVLLEMKKPPLHSSTNLAGFSSQELDYEKADRNGKRLLGLTREQSRRLFFVGDDAGDYIYYGWPLKFRMRYYRASKPTTLARIASERIDHFIKTKGAE